MAIRFADTIFWVAVVSCVVAQVAIVRSVLRMRGAMTASGMTRPRVAGEIAWVIVPAVALVIVLVLTWRAIHPPAAAADSAGPTPTHAAALAPVR